jgi:hypothetical protein
MTPYVEDMPTVNFMADYAAQLGRELRDPSVLVLIPRWAKPADIPAATAVDDTPGIENGDYHLST